MVATNVHSVHWYIVSNLDKLYLYVEPIFLFLILGFINSIIYFSILSNFACLLIKFKKIHSYIFKSSSESKSFYINIKHEFYEKPCGVFKF